jgi:hypothetical protein
MQHMPNKSCDVLPYNCLQTIHSLMDSNASQTMLYAFEADLPTVTAQRLKGLTTGTLPTFIDIGSNMNSSAVNEDNIIHQFIRHKKSNTSSPRKSLYVTGDDTWQSLYPEGFDDYKMFDSFNTMDLYTVDNGIMNTLDKINLKDDEDWKLFIAHFLGVDHIGHTFHVFHPLMRERVQLMDALLKKVINELPENSLLLFFGDHGMTDEGEHGGSTKEEIYSGLFLYSTHPFMHSSAGNSSPTSKEKNIRRIWNRNSLEFQHLSPQEILSNPPIITQMDLVPLFSFFADIPIPFSSLGIIPPELFYFHSLSKPSEDKTMGKEAEISLLRSLSGNANQIWKYLNYYFHGKELFSAETVCFPIETKNESSYNVHSSFSSKAGQCLEKLQSFRFPTDSNLDEDFRYLWDLYQTAVQSHCHYYNESNTKENEDGLSNVSEVNFNKAVKDYYRFLKETQEKMR